MKSTKLNLFKDLGTWDYALPQNWLDKFCERTGLNYHLVLSTTVWEYPEGSIFGRPNSCCQEVQDAIDAEVANAN